MGIAENRMGQHIVQTHTYYDSTFALKLMFAIAEFDRQFNAARRPVAGIKAEHDDVLAQFFRQLKLFHVRIGQSEERRGRADIGRGVFRGRAGFYRNKIGSDAKRHRYASH